MKIIEKLEIKNFRSFGNRKKTKTQILKLEDLNIFSGANDSGKSNILRALNLFFNRRTNLEDFLDFNNDFFKRENPDDDDIKEELITIKITFWNEKNKGINAENQDFTRLPEKFWVSRKWLKTSEFSSYQQDDGIQTAFKQEKASNWEDFFESDLKTLKSNVRANLTKQLTGFLDSIQYHYIPAIKDKSYFSHLYGELQQTLLKEENSDVNKNKTKFQDSIQESTEELMDEFKKVVNNDEMNLLAVFELPNLINLFRTLNVQTGQVQLHFRGDGIQAKLIPEILNFIAIKELAMKPSHIKKGEKVKKYFIWGFEEPENSYEYKNAQLLADRFKSIFLKNAQIFITTHSFNFLSIEGQNISTYRVWKDSSIESSRVPRIKRNNSGNFIFETNNELNNDYVKLNSELGIFRLNKELENLFLEVEKKSQEFIEKLSQIEKPIIYTEGNNIDYLKKVKEFIAPSLDIDIESLGGKDDIKKFFQRFSDAKFNRYKTFFVFDCDAENEYKICKKIETEYLIPYIFTQNTQNSNIEVQKGIENMFNDDLFEDEAQRFSITETKRDGQLLSRKRDLRKKEFCDFICEKRNVASDFENFKPFFNFITKSLTDGAEI